jgi:Cupin domain
MNTSAAKQLRVGDGAVPAAVGWARWGWQQRFHEPPQVVGDELVNEAGHSARSCHTPPKGAKQRRTHAGQYRPLQPRRPHRLARPRRRPDPYVTEGIGLIQSRGGEVMEIRPGDVIYTPPGEWHWHRAGPNHFKRFARSGDMIGAALAAWRHETNRPPPQRSRSTRPSSVRRRPDAGWSAICRRPLPSRGGPPVPCGPTSGQQPERPLTASHRPPHPPPSMHLP